MNRDHFDNVVICIGNFSKTQSTWLFCKHTNIWDEVMAAVSHEVEISMCKWVLTVLHNIILFVCYPEERLFWRITTAFKNLIFQARPANAQCLVPTRLWLCMRFGWSSLRFLWKPELLTADAITLPINHWLFRLEGGTIPPYCVLQFLPFISIGVNHLCISIQEIYVFLYVFVFSSPEQ